MILGDLWNHERRAWQNQEWCGALRLPAPYISCGCQITYGDGRMNFLLKKQENAG
jgi:hypothetical protein